jgi:hypothetical protein
VSLSQINKEVRDNLRDMDLLTKKGTFIKEKKFTDEKLDACYTVVAAHNDGVNITVMYVVCSLEAQLSLGGFSGYMKNVLKFTPTEVDLVTNTYMRHQIMKELQSRGVIREINYSY